MQLATSYQNFYRIAIKTMAYDNFDDLRKDIITFLALNKLSQTWLAKKLNTDQPLVSQWLSGKRVPRKPNILKLKNLLGNYNAARPALSHIGGAALTVLTEHFKLTKDLTDIKLVRECLTNIINTEKQTV